MLCIIHNAVHNTVIGGKNEYTSCKMLSAPVGGKQGYTPCKIHNTVIGLSKNILLVKY